MIIAICNIFPSGLAEVLYGRIADSSSLPELEAPVRTIHSGGLPASVIPAYHLDEASRPNWSSSASDELLEHKSDR